MTWRNQIDWLNKYFTSPVTIYLPSVENLHAVIGFFNELIMWTCLFRRWLYSTRTQPEGYTTVPEYGSQSNEALLDTVSPRTRSNLTCDIKKLSLLKNITNKQNKTQSKIKQKTNALNDPFPKYTNSNGLKKKLKTTNDLLAFQRKKIESRRWSNDRWIGLQNLQGSFRGKMKEKNRLFPSCLQNVQIENKTKCFSSMQNSNWTNRISFKRIQFEKKTFLLTMKQ